MDLFNFKKKEEENQRSGIEKVNSVNNVNDYIVIKGLSQNNLKNISLKIPKNKIVVFTGLSGSGKSSIVFDTIAAESQRQMNETYPTFIRSRLPKYEKPKADLIDNLSPSVVIDQSRLGGNARSTVGTITDLYAILRLLFSRFGSPKVGPASYFSFNDPNGMCKTCCGLGVVIEPNIKKCVYEDRSLNEDMINMQAFHPGNWYWKQYVKTGLFDPDKKFKDYSEKEKNLLLYGSYTKDGLQVNPKVDGLYNHIKKSLINKDIATSDARKDIREELTTTEECPVCHGSRLNQDVLNCYINGYNIYDMCNMEFTKLRDVLSKIDDERAKTLTSNLIASLTRMIDIGLAYLNLNRESSTLSGGEAQRVKLVRYMGSSLTGMIYIFDEPSTGMHPRDVYRMSKLLIDLKNRGNTVLIVEHDKDIISIADEVIDIGPLSGKNGGQVMFQGSYNELLKSDTITGKSLNNVVKPKENIRVSKEYLSIKNANIHNLKNVSVDIPLNIFTVITGVAGSGKSSLIRDVFAKEYEDKVVLIDQSPIRATNRSTAATYLEFFDDIRNLLAITNKKSASLFSFNSTGACKVCKGKGYITTELAFMDPITIVCEECDGKRYNKEALSYKYNKKNIIEILNLTVEEAIEFFEGNSKILEQLNGLVNVGLSYLTLGQPLSTLSGGERQRIKLARNLKKKGSIYVLDEPTTGLHASDVKNIIRLVNDLVDAGNTVIVIEHDLDVMKQADYIIDIGPDGGDKGGKVVYTGTVKDMVDKSKTITAQYLRKSLN